MTLLPLSCAVIAFAAAAFGQGGPTRPQGYLVGAGIYDITGPAAGLGMMGYSQPGQTTKGIHFRLWSRAFIVVDAKTGKRVVMATADMGILPQGVSQAVLKKLSSRFGGLYDERNVLLSATHTHAGPGGYSHYALYNLAMSGFSQQNFDIVVEGIFQSVARAHANLAPGTLHLAKGELKDASVNRSKQAYMRNPERERASYAPSGVDAEMSVLTFHKKDGSHAGMMAWFPVHGTSMKQKNRLISGDNKGAASYFFEKWKGADYGEKSAFVAAFPNGNDGDSSPNTAGDLGGSDEWECPKKDQRACTMFIGRKQYEKARQLFEDGGVSVAGDVDYAHAFVDFSSLEIGPEFGEGKTRRTCPAGIGLSMLNGATEDGLGAGFLGEGRSCEALKPLLSGHLHCPGDVLDCQGVKPVVLRTGLMKPFPWTPQILPVQIIRLGRVVVAAVPAEPTAMAGRRIKKTLLEALKPLGVVEVLITGYANAYAGYVTTREEYLAQHYEGASTHFGEWTLAGYQQELKRLAGALVDGRSVPAGPKPPDLSLIQIPKILGTVILDAAPLGRKFGDVDEQPKAKYGKDETVSVSFWGAHLANDPLIQGSFLAVQRRTNDGWVVVARDRDVETELHWDRVGVASSRVAVLWRIPDEAPLGVYRILHRGRAKKAGLVLDAYEGVTQTFEVVEAGKGTPAAKTSACSKDADCGDGYWCDAGLDLKKNSCKTKLALGEVCGAIGEAGVGHRCRSGDCKVSGLVLKCK